MASSTEQKIIVVLGATGGQGRGVVMNLLQDSDNCWQVRAVSREPKSERAQKFLADNQTPDGRLSVVYGDSYDPANLRENLRDAYGVFAVVSELKLDTVLVKEEDTAHELEAGRNIVDAAKHNNVKHFVFSSLPDMVKATDGKYPRIHHMNNKYIIEQYAREMLDCVTCVLPGFYYNNLNWAQYARRRSDGVVRFCAPLPSHQYADWLDSVHDIGRFAARIFALGTDKMKGKNYPVVSPKVTLAEMAETYTSVTGQPAVHDPLTMEQWLDLTVKLLGPAYREDVRHMMEWAAEAPKDKLCWGAIDPKDDHSLEDLGLSATTFGDWLKRTGWAGPPNTE